MSLRFTRYFSQTMQRPTSCPFFARNLLSLAFILKDCNGCNGLRRTVSTATLSVPRRSMQQQRQSLLQDDGIDSSDFKFGSPRQFPNTLDASPEEQSGNSHSSPPQVLSSPRPAHQFQQQTLLQPQDVATKYLKRPKITGDIESSKVQQLVRAYRTYGHYFANLDPLELRSTSSRPFIELDPHLYDITDLELDQELSLEGEILPGLATSQQKTMKVRDIISACKAIYSGTLSIEFMHLPDPGQREWLRERIEVPRPVLVPQEEKGRILNELLNACLLERFQATKYPNVKRYGLDGAEALAPAIATIIDHSADTHGINDVVVGSCHRGKMTMLPCVYKKPMQAIFAEFGGAATSELLPGMAGDVKYHLGQEGSRTTAGGRQVTLSLLANPSHLEAIDPIATGKAYAVQQLPSKSFENAMCLALHGDAAFAGQGVAYETLGLSRLPAYNVHGTIRVMVNNHIGFTTDIESSRSTMYCTDLAKYVDAPVIHVNADDIESVVFACRIAADWRAKFHSDIFVDLNCYRRFGHNELDQPSLTQPEMYDKVAKQVPTLEKYISKLIKERTFSEQEIEERKNQIWKRFEQDYAMSKEYKQQKFNHPAAWQNLSAPEKLSTAVSEPRSTAVSEDTLNSIMKQLVTFPQHFEPHRTLRRVIEARKKSYTNGIVDWSTAEALAFGTLCMENYRVRLTGQDVERGTFSQRHAVWHDQKSYERLTPLNDLSETQASFVVANSPLTEYAALGFEYGYTLANPNALVVWEAQFGDFANTAQVIIDNFISTAESKWMQRSGVALSLPHGYDGQGAEHSSARLERFLMLCSESGQNWPQDLDRQYQDCNMQIVYPTTPANYFHVLRRQLHRDFRKPLVILFSKSLLRHALTKSTLSDLTGESSFRPVLDDKEHGRTIQAPTSIKKVMLCTGQVYAALHQHREANQVEDVAVTRIEELHPFPWSQIMENLDSYPNAEDIVWVQEEPYNGGSWHYVRDRLELVLERSNYHHRKRVRYAGRATNAVTAAGLSKTHEAEKTQLLADAFLTR